MSPLLNYMSFVVHVCFFSSVTASFGGFCPPNEDFKFCTNPCGEARCSQNLLDPIFCPQFNDEVCRGGCVCSDGFVRNDDNVCIPETQCPAICPPGEQFTDCLESGCQQLSCSDLNDSGPCPIIEDDDDCTSGCICSIGFLRDSSGVCVPQENCPQFCPTNEEFSNCTQLVCRAQNCSQNENSVPCAPVIEDSCTTGCVCIDGTLRNGDGNCVPKDQCEGICQANEEFTECVETVCRAQDCSQVGQELACPIIELSDCTSGCVCSEGFVKDDDGDECIPVSQCPALTCPPNEEVNNCVQAICAPVNCSQINQPIACPLITEGSCIAGCVCISGFFRNDDGICVPEDTCFGLDCAENENLDICPGNCSDFCPTSENDNECLITSPDPITCGTPVCRCGFNLKRDIDNGTCIPTRDCPPFDCTARPNEVYDPCPPLCSDDCGQITPSGDCNFIGNIGIVLDCNPKCRCMAGFGRDNTGICVPLSDCQTTQPNQCDDNEEFSTCIQTLCRGDNCSQIGQQINCPLVLNEACETGCVCIAGNLRDDSGNCVPEDQCPNNGTQCSANEILNQCASACDDDSCPTSSDFIIPDCIGATVCLRRCQCAPNFKRDQNGDCIPEDQCPATGLDSCGPNEQFNDCPSVCFNDSCPTNLDDDDKIVSCTKNCGTPRCECIDNFRRDDSGNCVPIEDCPGICPNNEEFSSCPQELCRIQNCEQIGQNIACVADAPCDSGCVCIPGTLRANNGSCVPEDQCPGNQCGENERFNSCPSFCNTDACPVNLNDDVEVPCIALCGSSRCECVDNFARDDRGNCIPIGECPEICPVNEEFSSCAQNVCRAQQCSQSDSFTRIFKPDTPSCADIPQEFCQNGCVCVPRTLRNPSGDCVPEDQCPSKSLGQWYAPP